MTPEEFKKIGDHVATLWPLCKLNEDQAAIWRGKLAHLEHFAVHKAVSDAYAKSRWREPALGDVLEELAAVRRMTMGPLSNPLPDAEVHKIMQGDAEAKRKHREKVGQ